MRSTLINMARRAALLAKRMRSETAKKAPEKHYPAPYALIDLWEKHGGDRAPCRRQEIESFAPAAGRRYVAEISCGCSSCARNSKETPAASGRASRVHVIGAGTMGGDIAAWCAWNGLTVTLADMKSEPLGAAMKRAADCSAGSGARQTSRCATRSTG